jgi:hypothetical protein
LFVASFLHEPQGFGIAIGYQKTVATTRQHSNQERNKWRRLMDSSTEKKAKKTKEIDQKEESSKRQLTCWKEEQQGMSPFIGKRCCKPSQVSNDTFQRVTSQVPKPSRRPPKQREENAVQRQPPKTLALQRKIRALWNRLSEGNAETIAKSLETMLDALSDKAEKESFYSSLVHLLLESLNSHSSLVSSVHPVSRVEHSSVL